MLISIHAPLRGRPRPPRWVWSYPHFNPRPLAGATRRTECVAGIRPISIHAPLRGRHARATTQEMWGMISIHAPLRGRRRCITIPVTKKSFQSTPPCGGDYTRHGFPDDDRISIHAPLRGRPMAAVFSTSGERFQSTPPCGGDGSDLINFQTKSLFQSTPPCGGDPPEPGELEHSLISIHAPLRGRQKGYKGRVFMAQFQSTPPCGGDGVVHFMAFPPPPFQSTPPCGGDTS